MITMYNVVSADGFISRIDRSEDFIPDEMWPEFLDICKKHGAIIMGRKTYDTIQKYSESLLSSFEDLKVKKIIVSRDENFHPKEGYLLARSPKEACSLAENALMSSGPTLNTSMLNEGLIQTVILEKLPVKIEEGFKLFEEGVKPQMNLLSEEKKEGGREREVYTVSYL